MISRLFLDACCLISIIGIWPRFFESRWLKTSSVIIPFPLPKNCPRITIAQISDLHMGGHVSETYLNKILTQLNAQKPDLIVCTGDFLCNGKMVKKETLLSFCNRLQAPWGVYAVLGNHDYELGLKINSRGDYDVESETPSPFIKGLRRLLQPIALSGVVTQRAKDLQPHPELLQIFEEASIQLLNNRTMTLKGVMNITGVGEYTAGQMDPAQAFLNYDFSLPGIVLAHNPDAFPVLKQFPGQLLLAGHTHGGEVNLPWIRSSLNLLENPQYFQGLFHEEGKQMYVSQGLGGEIPFRFNARPEIVILNLSKA